MRHLLKYALFMLMLVKIQQVYAYETEIDGIKYNANLDNYEASVLSGSPNENGEVNIPSSIKIGNREFQVTSISSQAFAEQSTIKSVKLPVGITNISSKAFYGCSNMTNCNIPSSLLEMGDYCFAGCKKLSDVKLPSTMQTIGKYTFYGCSSLSSVTLPVGSTVIPEAMFRDCKSLSIVNNAENIIKVKDSAFDGCEKLEYFDWISNLETIGYKAFQNCLGMKYIQISDKTTSISDYAFSGCANVERIEIMSTGTLGNYVFSGISRVKSLYLHTPIKAKTLDGILGVEAIYSYNNIEREGIHDMESLKELYLYGLNEAGNIITNCPNLKYLYVDQHVDTLNIPSDRYVYIDIWGDLLNNESDLKYEIGAKIEFMEIYCPIRTYYFKYKEKKSLDAITGRYFYHYVMEGTGQGHKTLDINSSILWLITGNEQKGYGYYPNLRSIYVNSNEPPTTSPTFSDKQYVEMPLYVPYGTKEAYSQSDTWRKFFNIIEMDVDEYRKNSLMATDVAEIRSLQDCKIEMRGNVLEISASNSPIRIFTSDGKLIYNSMKTNNPIHLKLANHGIYIIKVGNLTKKIIY